MIVFITTYIPDPRTTKRIEVAKQVDSVAVICVKRKSMNLWTPNQEGVDYHIYECDMPSIKHPFKRLYYNLRFTHFVSKKLNELKPQCIYLCGIDCKSVALRYQKKNGAKLIYEIADVRECFLSNKKSLVTRFMMWYEQQLLSKISLLVLTSDQFYRSYYSALIEEEKVFYFPNIPELTVFNDYHKRKHDVFTIGFIGGLRYINQLKMLVDAASDLPVRIVFAGGGASKQMEEVIVTYCKDNSKIVFLGQYDYKKQIVSIYEMVDCVYSVYDADNANVRIALPNKLYEAAYCELPIIVAKNTYLSEIVNRYQTGLAVSHKDTKELKDTITMLLTDKERYNYYVDNCHNHKNKLLDPELPNKFRGVLENTLKAI